MKRRSLGSRFTKWNFKTTALAKNFTKIEEAALLAAQWLSCFMARFGAAEGTGMAAALWNAGVRSVPRSNVRVRRDERNAKISRLAVVLALFLVLLAGALLVTCRAVIDSMLRGATRSARGDITFTLPDGAFCRHLSFNNATTELMESTATPCPEAKPRGRESDRPSNHFAWGAR